MKILFIACYSPLINNSASIETLQYLNNLAKFEDNEIHLLTVNFPPNSIYYDEYILSMLDPKIRLHIISGGIVFEKIMPKKKNVIVNNKSNKFKFNVKGILRKAKRILAIPDVYLYWAIKASKYGIDLMKLEKFDVMFSMHEPPSSHICAYRIKKKFKELRWIAYWSDPWLKDSTREGSSFIRRKIEEKYEKEIIGLADKHVFVTKANRDDYVRTYNLNNKNTFIITRGYDEKVYSEIKNSEVPVLINNNKINVVYAGEIFSKLRDIRPFISAVRKIEVENPDLYEKLNILFFGNIDNDEVKKELIEIEKVKVSDRIPYKEALGYMINADILLLFGNKNSKQIPAKIYDYFGCFGYILVILGDENDPILEVVSNLEKCRVSINNSEEVKMAITDVCDKIIKGNRSNQINEYEWKNISKRLDLILRED